MVSVVALGASSHLGRDPLSLSQLEGFRLDAQQSRIPPLPGLLAHGHARSRAHTRDPTHRKHSRPRGPPGFRRAGILLAVLFSTLMHSVRLGPLALYAIQLQHLRALNICDFSGSWLVSFVRPPCALRLCGSIPLNP
jgi:hypothetical protein